MAHGGKLQISNESKLESKYDVGKKALRELQQETVGGVLGGLLRSIFGYFWRFDRPVARTGGTSRQKGSPKSRVET